MTAIVISRSGGDPPLQNIYSPHPVSPNHVIGRYITPFI